MYDALDVACYIIQRENEQGKTISNLKLQKVLYFVQAEFLVSTGEPCFKDTIEAWDFGPVVPTVYHKYKVYGSAQIPARWVEQRDFITYKDKIIIDDIVNECSKYSAAQLTEITQCQSPWLDSYTNNSKIRDISNKSIRDFFLEGENDR